MPLVVAGMGVAGRGVRHRAASGCATRWSRSHIPDRCGPTLGDDGPVTDAQPAEFLLDGYPVAIRDTGRALRALDLTTIPGSVETVRPGWRWIGYSLPEKGRVRNFAWIGPEHRHIH